MQQLGRTNRKAYIWEISIEELMTFHIHEINMNPTFQRNFVWDNERASGLIHSLLVDYFVNPIILGKEDKELILIDGKQRLTAIKEFAENKFSLHPKTPDVFGIKVANLTLKELPQDLHRKFLNHKLVFMIYESIERIDAFEVFRRLNNGTPMASFARNAYRSVIQEQIVKLAHHPFFHEHYPLTPALQKTFVDEQLVTISSMLFTEDFQSEGVSVNDIENYLDWLYKENRSLKVEQVTTAADYMENTAKHLTVRMKRKVFKKVDTIPMLLLAYELHKQGVPCKLYSEFLKEFFADNTDSHPQYNSLREEGYNQRKNVMQRLDILRQAFENFKLQK